MLAMVDETWGTATLDELKSPNPGAIAIGPFGSRMKAEVYVPEGVPVVRGNNLGPHKEFVGEFVHVSEEFAEKLGNSNIYDGDLVFPHRGNIGEVGIVTGGANAHFVLSTSMMKITVNRNRVDPLFLYYFFKSYLGRHELLKNASQVGTPGIATPLTSLRSIRVPVPPLKEQQAIACILGTLDEKIELNRRMNQTLEQGQRALWAIWAGWRMG
jgi:type I restriction enzyme S subunit